MEDCEFPIDEALVVARMEHIYHPKIEYIKNYKAMCYTGPELDNEPKNDDYFNPIGCLFGGAMMVVIAWLIFASLF